MLGPRQAPNGGRRLADRDSELLLNTRACCDLQSCCSTRLLPACQMSIAFLRLSTLNTRRLTFHFYRPVQAGAVAAHTRAPEVPSCLLEHWQCGAEVNLCFAGFSLRASAALQATNFVAPSASQPRVAERQLQRPEDSRPPRF